MASAKLKKKSEKFLSPEQTRTIKPADLKNHMKLKDLSQDDLVELLCLMEGELQAKDVLLKAVLSGKAGEALPLSNLLNDAEYTEFVDEDGAILRPNKPDDDDEVWLGEPSAHLNHVSAYHQVVQEQMQSIVIALEKQHKQVVNQLEEERRKHAVDTAQGDDVTYMLEKEKEKLQLQIDNDREKYATLEEERDSLLDVIEKERREQYNAFTNLMNDCKSFALQLVQQTSKFEQYQKEIDKEKQKNKVLSELMVEETKRFKEKIKFYEDEVNDFHVLEQKRNDLETKLSSSEKQYKETFHQLNEERFKNGKLQYQLNQLRKQIPPEFNNGFSDSEEEDILLVQDQIEIPIKQALTSSINLTNNEREESPEPQTVLATPIQFPTGKVAMVQKSSTVKQNLTPTKASIKSSGIISVNINHNNLPSSKHNSPHNTKRHSCEDSKYRNYSSSEESLKRNSLENLDNTAYYSNSIRQHSSYEEMRDVGGGSPSQKRNSYEGDNRKHPPPAPPRRVSSLTAPPEKTPIVKIPHSLQPRRSAQNASVTAQLRSNSTDEIPVLLVVICNYGWEFNNDFGIAETNRLTTYLDILYINYSSTWSELTELINMTFDRECEKYMSGEEGIHSSCICSYEYQGESWTSLQYPHLPLETLLENNNDDENIVSVRLKGNNSGDLDNLSYSTLMSIATIEECLRIIEQEKKLMTVIDGAFEGKHFTSSLTYWLKTKVEKENESFTVVKVEPTENLDVFNLANTLLTKGVLSNSAQNDDSSEKFILILDIDFMETEGFTPLIFDWLIRGSERMKKNQLHNGYHGQNKPMNGEDNFYLNNNTIVMAYVTKKRVPYLTQSTYRLFKIITLPPLLHALLNRWLSQKLLQYSPQMISETMMFSTIRWLSNVYQNLQKSFTKIDLADHLPDIDLYLHAPIYDTNKLMGWIKTFWTKHIALTVEESVLHRTVAATQQQRDSLIKATLKALFEKVIRPGCPVSLEF